VAGYDRWVLGERLKERGWTEHSVEDDGWCWYAPPASLWEERPVKFDVYAARDLQDLLGEPTEPVEDEVI
jgi:hypothetical protein